MKGTLQCKEASQALEENFLRSVSIAQIGVSAESWAEVGRHCTSLGGFTMIFLIKFGAKASRVRPILTVIVKISFITPAERIK